MSGQAKHQKALKRRHRKRVKAERERKAKYPTVYHRETGADVWTLAQLLRGMTM